MAEPKIEDVTEKEPEVKIEEVDDDAPPALEEKDEAGDAAGDEGAAATGHRAKQSRSEKKTRKQIQKLGMKPVSDVVRMTVKKGKQVLFVVSHPDVFKSPNSDTYVVFGEAKVDDSPAAGLGSGAAAMPGLDDSDVPALDEDEVPGLEEEAPAADSQASAESGVTEKDIELVVTQAKCTREKAIEVLKKTNGDIVNAIMELTV
mmetsp:Transcript_25480/g.28303  ORF Transcript_25480/g.28303 Transcript_25480/m.28303 type:complete len:203 (-) Transcript_25480:25-633(-)|eukprot:CAMPEP_0205831564 /NCGR_PEP_ID=MMETSP0206-20130828/44408_1 /ASSEMBLY_ACC=CAM_ASM_000279 /TAXON_ID=36767 /ORGANISM="Euplotes focardii, Strain TN1" /LENGTH=202 /DNA_ID=CAMNT_0053136307 /DNA_START=68 /DNA_END=676 /DNA_ORIENTATION=-